MRLSTIILFFFLVFNLNAQSLNWSIENKTFNANDTIGVKFYVSGLLGLGAYQFALKADTSALKFHFIDFTNSTREESFLPENADSLLGKSEHFRDNLNSNSILSPIQITGVLPGLGQGNFSWYGRPGYVLTPGEIRTLWSAPQGKTIPDNSHVFTVWFVAKSSGTICSKFKVWYNHPVLKPRAYKAIPLTLIPITFACLETSVFESQAETRNNQSDIKVFPNPVIDYLNIQSELPVQIEVYNSVGILVTRKEIVSDKIELEKGLNFIKIIQGETSFVKTIIKL